MKVGVTLPMTEIGDDFGALRAYIQAAEGLGYEVRVTTRHHDGRDVAQASTVLALR